MACEGCNEKIRRKNAEHAKTEQMAQEIANKTGEWVGVYQFQGTTFYAIGEEANGKPIEQYFTPKLPNPIVQNVH